MSYLVHVQADDPPNLPDGRVMTRAGDYQYAAPGLAALAVAEFESQPDAIENAVVLAGDSTHVVNVFRQLSPARGYLTADGVREGNRPRGSTVLSVIMDVQQEALADFHGWYDEEHLPKLVAVPGILAAVRYESLHGPRFLAWYELADRSVVASAEFAAASVLTPRTAAVTARLDWASQLYLEQL